MQIKIDPPSLDDLAELLKRQGEDERARQLAEQKAKEEAEAKAKAKAEREAKAKAEREAAAKAKAEREAKAKAAAEAKAKAAEAAAAKAKAEAEAKAKAAAEAKAKAEREAAAKAKAEAEAEAERKRKAAERLRKAAEAAKRQEEEDRIRLQKLFEEEERKRKEAEAKAKAEAEAKAKAEAEAKAKAEAEAKAKAEEESALEKRKREIAEEVERKRREEEAAAKEITGADASSYYDILRSGELGQDPIAALQRTLDDQGYLTTGAEMAEAGAYGPVEDKYIVPGGLDIDSVGEFKFDKTFADFKGHPDFDYGELSDARLKEFQEELLPVMAPEVAQAQLEGQSYQNALIQAYERSPQVQQIYAKYNVNPQRIGRKHGSEYVFDPFGFSEIQTVDRSPGLSDYVKLGATLVASIAAPQLLVKAGVFNSLPAAMAATSAATTAAKGGDFEDVLKSAGLSFVGANAAQKLASAKEAAQAAATLAEQSPTIANAAAAAAAAAEYGTAQALFAATSVGTGALTGNVGAGILSAFGAPLTTHALNQAGLTPEMLAVAGVDQDLLVNGLVQTQTQLARGVELDEALAMGLGQYITSGGGIAGVNKDNFFEKMGEVIRGTGKAIGGIFSPSQADIAAASTNSAFDNIGGAEAIQLPYTKEPLPEQVAASQKLAGEEYSALVGQSPKGPNEVSDWRLERGRAVFDEDTKTFLIGPNNAIRVNFADQPNLWDFLANPEQRKLTFATIGDVLDAVPEGSAASTFMAERYGDSWAANLVFEPSELKDLSFGGAAPSTSVPTVTNIDLLNDPNVDLESLLASTAGQAPTIQYTAPDGSTQRYSLNDVTSGSIDATVKGQLLGQAIDQIARAMYEEDRANGGNTTPADFRSDAVNTYVELRDEGYSHLRLLEESGVDLTGSLVDIVSATDLEKLENIRAGGDQEAYLRALGTVDGTTGRNHEGSLYRSGVEQASGLYDLARRAVDAAEETGDDKWIIGTALAIEAGADVANAFLGLAALVGINPESTELGKTLKAITDITGESKPEEYKKGLQDINRRLQAAQDQAKEEGLGTSDSWILVGKAIMGAAAENPTEFVLDFIVKEAASEIIPFVVGGVAFGGAKLSAAAAKKFGDDAAQKFAENLDASDIAVGVTMVSDAAEEAGGAAASGYSEGYNAKIKQLTEQNARLAEFTGMGSIPLSDAQIKEAEEFATEVAQKAGVTGLVLSVVSDGALGGNQLARGLFGDKATNAADEFVTSLTNRVTRVGQGAGREFMLEGLQEGGVQAIIEGEIYEIDPDRPMSAAIAQNAILGAVIGSSVGGGIGAVAEAGDVLANVVQKTSPTVRAAIENAKRGALSDAQTKEILAGFGITQGEFGDLQTSLLNDAFDADYTSTTESRDAFQAANPNYNPTDADIRQFTGEIAENRLADSVADLVDRSYIDAQEAIDAAALEGLTLTNEQVAQYVRQTESGQAEAVLNSLRSDVFDPMYVTNQEARDYFADIGYTPTQEDLAEFVGKSEEYASDNVAEYSENMLLLQLDGLLGNPNTTPLQLDSLLDQIESINPDSTARADAGIDDGGNRPQPEPEPEPEPEPDPVDDTTPEPDLTADQIAALSDQLTESEQQLNDRIDQLQGEGKTRDEALAQAISELAGQLGTTTQTLLDIIGNSESSLRTDFRDELANLKVSLLGDMSNLETSILAKVAEYERAGLSRDEALARAIDELAGDLGTTKESLIDVVANSELTIREDFRNELVDLKASLVGDMSSLETNLLEKIAEYEATGLSRDEALAQAIADVSAELGTTEENLLDTIEDSELAIREDFRDELTNLETSLSEDMSNLEANILDKVNEYENAGLSRDEALSQAIDDLAGDLGTTKENLLITIANSELAIREDFKGELTGLKASLLGDMSNLEASILDRVAEYEAAGLSRDEALAQAIEAVSGELGTTEQNLLGVVEDSALAVREDFRNELTTLKTNLSEEMSNLETNLLGKMAEYENAGLSRDEALAKAIADVSGELGTTEQNLLDRITDSDLAIREDFKDELGALKTSLSEDMSSLETNLLEKMAEYENAGLSRDEALARAIEDVSGELGTTEQNLLDRIAGSELAIREDFKGELESLQADLSEGMSNIEANLLGKIAEYEGAGLSRDEALAKAIEDVSGELGTTEQNLLDRITDSDLAIREDFTNELSALRTTLSEDVANLETSLLEKMAEYEGAGLSRDEALARSVADVSTELGTTEQNLLDRIADSDTAIREEFKDEIDNLQASLAGDVANLEANLLEKIAGYEAAGLSRDEALSQSVADVSAELGTTEQNLLDRIAGSELAIREDFGTELANLQASLSGDVANLETNLLEKIAEYEAAGLSRDEALALAIEDVSGDVAGLETSLLNKVAEYEAAGLSRDEALSRAVADVSGDVASLETNLLEKIAEYEAAGVSRDEALTKAIEDVSGDVTNLETTLLNKVAEYEAAGMSRDEALAKTVDELASDLGTTKETLLDAIADSELSVREDFKSELADLQTSLSGEVADLETNVLDKMAEYEAAGLSRDEALAKAIEDVSGDVDATTRTLLTKIDEAEQAGADRDTALRTSISDLASELGVTEETLLARIGESEESLRAAIGETEADLLRAISGAEGALTAEIEAVAELVGKPASEVTDADIDFVADLIAQQEAINDPATYTQEQLAYDVTGDGVVDQADLDLLQQARTGQDVLFDLDSMFAPTGLYAAQQQTQQAIQRQMEQQQQQQIQTQQELQQQQELQRQQQMQQQMQSQQAIQTQIAQEGERDAKRDFFNLLMGSSDLTGQKVTVDQSPLAQINYLYDIGGGSIFGDPNKAGFYERATPYSSGVAAAVQPRPLPTATPPVRRRRGGIIDANDELLRIIGES